MGMGIGRDIGRGNGRDMGRDNGRCRWRSRGKCRDRHRYKSRVIGRYKGKLIVMGRGTGRFRLYFNQTVFKLAVFIISNAPVTRENWFPHFELL